jgi:hypothetical protein
MIPYVLRLTWLARIDYLGAEVVLKRARAASAVALVLLEQLASRFSDRCGLFFNLPRFF